MKNLFLLLFVCLFASAQAQFNADWESIDQREIPTWWSDAKFGIFIHWGLYSVPAYAPANEVKGIYEKYSEHYYNRLLTGNKYFTDYHQKHYGDNFSYADFAPMFKAEHFNPAEWADLFKEAGAKYVVLTSKHHDGFCLWPSSQTPQWNSVVMGPHLDIIDTLSTSVRDAGMRFGLYYSLLEWAHPLYSESTMEQWVDSHMTPQLKELVNMYHPDIIFSDDIQKRGILGMAIQRIAREEHSGSQRPLGKRNAQQTRRLLHHRIRPRAQQCRHWRQGQPSMGRESRHRHVVWI